MQAGSLLSNSPSRSATDTFINPEDCEDVGPDGPSWLYYALSEIRTVESLELLRS